MKLLLACLAVWRICHFLAVEDGPAAFMYRIRYRFSDTWVWDVLTCVSCSSAWVSLPFAFVYFRQDSFLLSWLALSASATILEVIHAALWIRG